VISIDNVLAFQNSGVPEHVISLVNILLEEEREGHKKGYENDYQPCLEFFLQNKIFEIFCVLGERDVGFWIFL
jgi:hypothetical protein